MGMFDSVEVPCPRCGKKIEAQSKSGDCCLSWYSMPGTGDNPAPMDVMTDVNRHAPFLCSCGCTFEVQLVSEPTWKTVDISTNQS